MMVAFRRFVSRFPLVTFFILAYAISWSIVIPANGGILPYGPAIAALIVLGVTSGRRGLADLWRQMTHWRVAWIWYLVAPGIVVAYVLLALVVNGLLGATMTSTAHLQSPSAVLPVIMMLLLFGGQWEEPGWSGYALPRLQERFASRPAGILLASLILGALRAGWHLPLVLYGAIPWYDALLYSFALQFLITWLYIRTDRSVLIVMLFHLTSNVTVGLVKPLYASLDWAQYTWLFIVFAWLIVFVILSRAVAGLGWRNREDRIVVDSTRTTGDSIADVG
jgi:hypothetical protein